jgi:RNA polymerase sigma-70 factor, ECF subfamily
MEYLRIVDAAAPQPGDLTLSLPSSQPQSVPFIEVLPQTDIPAALVEELWVTGEAAAVELTRSEFAAKLMAVGTRHNFGLSAEAAPAAANIATFLHSLHLTDLALAHACALGRELAWQRFFSLYRAALTQAAIAITGSATLGHDLAESLHSQLFGLTEREGQRRSPLDSYSGRGSLLGWLRTTLAQRHIDHHRQTHREVPLGTHDVPVPAAPASPSQETTLKLEIAIKTTLRSLAEEDRFLLSAYFLDQRTLHQIAGLMRVHEATVSRKLKRLTGEIRKLLLKSLQTAGLNRRAAEEALGTDPRDLSVNLRKLLQYPSSQPFSDKTAPPGRVP